MSNDKLIKDVLNKDAAKEKDAATSKGTTAVTDALDSFTKQISATTDSVTEGVSAATSLISGKASEFTKSLTDTSQSFIKDTTEQLSNSKLGSVLDSVTEGTKETIGKVESLVGSASEAVLTPVAFVTKTASDLLSPVTGSKDGGTVADSLLKGKSGSQLDTLAKKTGISTSSGNGFMSAIGKVTSFVSGGIKSATSTVSGVIKSVTGVVKSVTSTVTGVIDTVTTTAGSIVNGARNAVQSVTRGVTQQANDLLSSCCDALPEPFKGKVRNAGDGLLGKMSSYLRTANESISLKIPDTKGVMSSLLQSNKVKSTTSSYPKYTTSNGGTFTGIHEDSALSSSAINTFYKAAEALCPNTKKPAFTDYRTNKDTYDVLLQLAGQNGMSDLVSQLLDCDKMRDGRSEALLRQLFPKAIENGDPYLYQSLLKGTGVEKIAAPIDQLRMLNANMSLNKNTDDVTQKKEAYANILSSLKVTTQQLVEGNTYGTKKAYHAPSLVAMSANNTQIIDTAIGKNDRVLGLQLFNAYVGH